MVNIFRFIYGNQLTEQPIRKRGPGTCYKDKNLGWVFLGSSNPAIFKSCRSYSSLIKIANGEIQGLKPTYFKVNTFYRNDMSRKDCLRWLNAFYVDLDEENLSLKDVLDRIQSVGLPEPSLINESPHGWHLFWFIEPKRAKPHAVNIYESISKTLARTLKGADIQSATAEHYMRIPYNVKFFKEIRYTIDIFWDWHLINKPKLVPLRKNYKTYNTAGDCLSSDAAQEMLKGVEHGRRDNACFTLALCYLKDGHTFEKALSDLKEWNKKNDPPLPYSEIAPRVKSAYSGKYHGPKDSYVFELTGMYIYRPLTSARPRKERVRDHLAEIQDDILNYIKSHGGHVSFTQSFFADFLGVAISSFKMAMRALRKSGKVIALIKGRGRARRAIYALKEVVAQIIRDRIDMGIPWAIEATFRKNLIRELLVYTDIQFILTDKVVGGYPAFIQGSLRFNE